MSKESHDGTKATFSNTCNPCPRAINIPTSGFRAPKKPRWSWIAPAHFFKLTMNLQKRKEKNLHRTARGAFGSMSSITEQCDATATRRYVVDSDGLSGSRIHVCRSKSSKTWVEFKSGGRWSRRETEHKTHGFATISRRRRRTCRGKLAGRTEVHSPVAGIVPPRAPDGRGQGLRNSEKQGLWRGVHRRKRQENHPISHGRGRLYIHAWKMDRSGCDTTEISTHFFPDSEYMYICIFTCIPHFFRGKAMNFNPCQAPSFIRQPPKSGHFYRAFLWSALAFQRKPVASYKPCLYPNSRADALGIRYPRRITRHVTVRDLMLCSALTKTSASSFFGGCEGTPRSYSCTESYMRQIYSKQSNQCPYLEKEMPRARCTSAFSQPANRTTDGNHPSGFLQ